jgi:hypothetical protein
VNQAERLNELRIAANAKIDTCRTLDEAIKQELELLERTPRTVGLQAELTGMRATLASEQAAAKYMLADVIGIVNDATKAAV